MIASPCTAVCHLPPGAGWCIGCGRTLGEIERWLRAGDAERVTIFAAAAARLRERAA